MHILVTGGAGFLGSHLCRRLIAAGHDVLCIDNLLTGTIENIALLLKNPQFRFVDHDVIKPYPGQFDRIYNLACPGSPPQYQRNPLATVRTSFLGTDNLLDLATRSAARFFQASTSEVYGDPAINPQTEDYRGSVNPIGPRACYDEGKRVAETLCFDYRRMYGTSVKVGRIFNTYGPLMNFNDGRVVSNFIVQALQNKPITIFGGGQQTRSFCYVDDLIDGIVRLMESAAEVVGPINLGNPGEVTMLELAEMVVEITGTKSRIIYQELPEDDPQQRNPDISKAMALLDWQPKIPLHEGLVRTVADFDRRLSRVVP